MYHDYTVNLFNFPRLFQVKDGTLHKTEASNFRNIQETLAIANLTCCILH